MGLYKSNDEQAGIERFIEAQKRDYETALAEIRSGKKETHWIWYIFPQMIGLGHSYNAHLYGIRDKKEAEDYLNDKILGKRLREITSALLELQGTTANQIFGGLDAMKVNSSMTLFDHISPDDIFAKVIDRYYDGKRCKLTLQLLNQANDTQSILF